MDRRPSSAGPPPAGRVTLTLHGPIGELAAALRTLADAVDRLQASSAVTYTATVEADAPGSAQGGMTRALADQFVSQLSSAAVDVLALLCHNAPQLTYEDLQAQAQLGVSRTQIGGVLTSLAAGRKRLPRGVDYPIKRDAQHRRYRIEPAAAELLLSAVDRARGVAPPKGWSTAEVKSQRPAQPVVDPRVRDRRLRGGLGGVVDAGEPGSHPRGVAPHLMACCRSTARR